MNEQLRILNMLSEGKISSDEASKLLDVLRPQSKEEEPKETRSNELPKLMIVKVSPKNGSGDKVNVKIPFKLFQAGIKLASFLPENVQGKVDSAIKSKGINIELSKINQENIAELLETFKDFSVDVDGENETVQIYCE